MKDLKTLEFRLYSWSSWGSSKMLDKEASRHIWILESPPWLQCRQCPGGAGIGGRGNTEAGWPSRCRHETVMAQTGVKL